MNRPPVPILLCSEMPELLVMRLIGDLPEYLNEAVDDHVAGCAGCATKLRALTAAAHTARRRGGGMIVPDLQPCTSRTAPLFGAGRLRF